VQLAIVSCPGLAGDIFAGPEVVRTAGVIGAEAAWGLVPPDGTAKATGSPAEGVLLPNVDRASVTGDQGGMLG